MKKKELLSRIERLEDKIKALEAYIKTPFPVNINDIVIKGEQKKLSEEPDERK